MSASARAAAATGGRSNFDLYTRTGGGTVFLRFSDRGVWLADDRIGWTAGSHMHERRLREVCEVNLLTAVGTLAFRYGAVVCRIEFRDGDALRVFASGSLGTPDPAHTAAYLDFIDQLHRRLAVRGGPSIAYTTGYSLARYRTLVVLVGLLGLILAGGVVAALIEPGLHSILTVAAAAAMQWTLIRTLQANAPRRYNPAHIPEALVSGVAISGPGEASLDGLLALPRQPAPPPFPLLGEALRSRRVRAVLIAAGGLAVGLGIAWTAGVEETPTMFEPGAAQRALAAIEQRGGDRLNLRRLTVTPREVTAMVESTRMHADRSGLASYMELWRAAHATLFSGWREWDRVSGPTPADGLSIGEEGVTKTFGLRAQDLAGLAALAKTAAASANTEVGAVAEMRLERPNPPKPPPADPLQWTIRLSTPRGPKELLADGRGRITDPATAPAAPLGFPANAFPPFGSGR